jgi:hypothetical protein
MSTTIVNMSVSLDGFVSHPYGVPETCLACELQ